MTNFRNGICAIGLMIFLPFCIADQLRGRFPKMADVEAHIVNSLKVNSGISLFADSKTGVELLVLHKSRAEVLKLMGRLLEDKACKVRASADLVILEYEFPYVGPNNKNCLHIQGFDIRILNGFAEEVTLDDRQLTEVNRAEYFKSHKP